MTVLEVQAPGARVSRPGTYYDAFACAASDGASTAVIGWKQDSGHVTTATGEAVVRVTRDRGATLSPITPLVPRKAGDPARTVAGLTWNARARIFVALLHEMVVDSKGKITSRSCRLLSSPDGTTWRPYGSALAWPSAAWVFASDVHWVDDGSADGVLLVAAYASLPDAPADWATVILSSSDGAATWSQSNFPRPTAGTSAVEPRFASNGGRVWVATRHDKSWTLLLRSSDDFGASWGSPKLIASQASGEPGIFVTRDGTMVCWYRDLRSEFPGSTSARAHAPFTMLVSKDEGATWDDLGDPTKSGLPSMYQGFAEFDDGTVLAAYGLEGSATTLWASSAVFVARMVPLSISAAVGRTLAGLPVVRVRSASSKAWRRVDGGEWERVRQVVDESGALVDAEAPAGRVVTYTTSLRPGAPTTTVRPQPPQTLWLVVPDDPEASVPLLVQDGGAHAWEPKRTVATLEIPGGTPFSRDFGPSGRSGSIAVWCLDARDVSRVTAALDVPGVKMLAIPESMWILARAPRWVMVTGTQEQALGISTDEQTWGITLSVIPASRPAVIDNVGHGWASLSASTWSALASSWGALS